MKLITASPEAALAAVRKLSESAITSPNGRQLQCRPFVPFAAPLARSLVALEDIAPLVVEGEDERRQRRHLNRTLLPILEDFRSTAPGEFHTADFTTFAHDHGWRGDNVRVNAMLNNKKRHGALIVAAKTGRKVTWRFP